MSSSKAAPTRRIFLERLLTLGGAGLALSACGFSPVHRDTPGLTNIRAQLAGIHIMEATDRSGQVLRNELLFLFGQGTSTPRNSASHVLSISATTKTVGSIVSRSGVTESRILTINARYQLIELATQSVAINNRTSAQAAFDVLEQQFANARAKRDAENRAAKDIARKINDQVTAYLAATG